MSVASTAASLGDGRLTTHDSTLDPTFVRAALDPEEAVEAPARAPRVGHLPVRRAIVDAPARDLHRVAAEHGRVGRVLVDAGVVRHKVLVDREGRLDGAPLHDGRLDSLLIGVALGREELHAVALRLRAILARARALRRVAVARAVREALVGREPESLHVVPRETRHAAVAAHVAFPVARHEVLRGEHDVDAAAARNVEAIGKRLRGAERPAAAAVALVANRVDGALPLVGRVEALRDVVRDAALDGEPLEDGADVAHAHQALRLRDGHAGEAGVRGGLPGEGVGGARGGERAVEHGLLAAEQVLRGGAAGRSRGAGKRQESELREHA
mmetsp:Transcript_9888/g.32390  ORF Transcript_9888/g.32390 Transcript_9888/m.32390 type:complete len:328 (+) Transcript_9888:115-1098(+)